jgi:hypothetical protein
VETQLNEADRAFAFFSIIPIITILFYVGLVSFIIWFLIKLIKTQQERNNILKTISEKLDKL